MSQDSDAETRLRAGDYVFRLGGTVLTRGTVVDPDGRTVAGAKVLIGYRGTSSSRRSQTETNGVFSVADCKPGRTQLTVEADSFAPASLNVELGENSDPVRVVLQRGGLLRLRVFDRSGRPVPRAQISLSPSVSGFGARGNVLPPQTDFPRTTDELGRLRWENAPPGERVFSVYASGFTRLSDVKVKADGEEHDIELPPPLTLYGSVCDAVTGQPVPRCRIASGSSTEWDGVTNYSWSTTDRFWFDAPGGTFRHVLNEPVHGDATEAFVFKFVADWYAPFISRAVEPHEGEVRLDIVLRPATNLLVTVLSTNGQLAVHADIGLVSPGAHLVLVPGGLSHQNPQSAGVLLSTDDQRQFPLPPDDTIQRVIAASAGGYAETSIARLLAEPVLRLQSWGRLEGTYLTNGVPVAGVGLSFSPGQVGQWDVFSDWETFHVETDAEGRFAFPKIPPGRHHLERIYPMKPGSSLGLPVAGVEVRPGETTTIAIGRTRYNVGLQVRWPEGMPRKENWSVIAVIEPAFTDVGSTSTAPARPAFAGLEHYILRERSHDHFVGENLDAGNYRLTVRAIDPAAATNQPLASTTSNRSALPQMSRPLVQSELFFSVPADPASGTLDLGEVELKPNP